MIRCYTCKRKVDPESPHILRQVTGWEKPRTQGGTNHVIDRKLTGELMCTACAMSVLHGIHPDQGKLL